MPTRLAEDHTNVRERPEEHFVVLSHRVTSTIRDGLDACAAVWADPMTPTAMTSINSHVYVAIEKSLATIDVTDI